ncbi:PCSK4-like protein [Mya arenaria]|uniref:PCSK4-like protein n=1 Tax=Mya arenaria TaxID=6604 RepID=A0ABY7EXU3_MYAAR|nr:PCSK4-like protein [Mya arenaria]
MKTVLFAVVNIYISMLANIVESKSQLTDKLIVKVQDYTTVSKELFQSYVFLYRIVPGIFVFKQKGFAGHELTKAELDKLRHKYQVEQVEQVRRSFIKAEESMFNSDLSTSEGNSDFGMGIEQARSKGYTGEGVTVGILDVGACTDHPFLSDKITKELSWNFPDNSKNVDPDWNPNYAETYPLLDHGTNMCGLVASSEGCGGGVAPDSRLAVLKVFRMDPAIRCLPCMDEDHYALALAFRPEEIHIYASGLSLSELTGVSIAIKATIQNGIIKGRGGKGSIYVYPAGNVGNAFVNNPYTVSVNGIGVNGTVPSFASASATVITSVLAEGRTLESKLMSTTSCKPERNCSVFNGLSPATAITAAIITFALQNNSALTYRDVFHILVQASEHEQLVHSVYGFGLLNAEKVGSLASNWNFVGSLVAVTQTLSDKPEQCKNNTCSIKVNLSCSKYTACVQSVEQVFVTVNLTTPSMKNTRLYIDSPGGTRSVLLDRYQSSIGTVNNLDLRSVHFWDEQSIGEWTITLEIESQVTESLALIVSSMTWYGTGNEAQVTGGFSFGAFAAILYPIVVFSATGCFFLLWNETWLVK